MKHLDPVEPVRDNVADTSTPPLIPEWHIEVLKRRRAAAKADPDAAIPWDEMKARLLNHPPELESKRP